MGGKILGDWVGEENGAARALYPLQSMTTARAARCFNELLPDFLLPPTLLVSGLITGIIYAVK